MKINVDSEFIEEVVKKWNSRDEQEVSETQEVIEAIVCELKKDRREKLRHSYGQEAEELDAHYQELIGQVQNQRFWEMMDHLLHFRFEF